MSVNLSRLDGFNLTDLMGPATSASSTRAPIGAPGGEPAFMDLALIDFDADQPRRGLDAGKLDELAASIRVHGVLMPVSLQPSPAAAGRWVVNMGERRVRAARLAGLARVPYVVHASLDPYAQAVENLQREDLSPFDLAAFIARREQAGDARGEIARRLGYKSHAFVSELAELHGAPESVRAAYDAGRVRATRTLRLLVRLACTTPEAAAQLLAGSEPIASEAVAAAAAKAGAQAAGLAPDGAPSPAAMPTARRAGGAVPPEQAARCVPAADGAPQAARTDSGGPTAAAMPRRTKPVATGLSRELAFEYAGRRVRIDASAATPADAADVVYEDSGARARVGLRELRPLEWVEPGSGQS